jgi:hypothetical protein
MFEEDSRYKEFCKEFEKSGESGVRVGILTGEFKSTPLKHECAIEWCRRQEENRIIASSSKRDEREIKTLWIAIAAMVIAAISAHKDIMWLITSFISWPH